MYTSVLEKEDLVCESKQSAANIHAKDSDRVDTRRQQTQSWYLRYTNIRDGNSNTIKSLN